jgi:hypothetical protein
LPPAPPEKLTFKTLFFRGPDAGIEPEFVKEVPTNQSCHQTARLYELSGATMVRKNDASNGLRSFTNRDQKGKATAGNFYPILDTTMAVSPQIPLPDDPLQNRGRKP